MLKSMGSKIYLLLKNDNMTTNCHWSMTMKILITGMAGSGKSLFLARFKANPKYRHFDFFDTDDYQELARLIRNSENCIAVAQAKSLLPCDIHFDRKYSCLREFNSNYITISDGFIFEQVKINTLVSSFYNL